MKWAKGYEFHGPDGQGYRLTREVESGEFIMAKDFEAFGGAQEPVPDEILPRWLSDAIEQSYHLRWLGEKS